MATAAQIAANRANARRSTGPRTPEGKAASSRNALTHGANATDDTILATAPDTYLDDFRAHFQPVGVLEEHLVTHLAVLASRRTRLNAALDALLELNERHALMECQHERYGINTSNGHATGQPSWQPAMRRYDGHPEPVPHHPELVSDPALDPDPILCSLAYTLSGPRAAALFRHEAAVDRRFSATLKEITTLQSRRQDPASLPPAVLLSRPSPLPGREARVGQAAAVPAIQIEPNAPLASPSAARDAPLLPTPAPTRFWPLNTPGRRPDPLAILTPGVASLSDLRPLPAALRQEQARYHGTPVALAQFEANMPAHAGEAATREDLPCQFEANAFRVLPRDPSRPTGISSPLPDRGRPAAGTGGIQPWQPLVKRASGPGCAIP